MSTPSFLTYETHLVIVLSISVKTRLQIAIVIGSCGNIVIRDLSSSVCSMINLDSCSTVFNLRMNNMNISGVHNA